MLYNKNNVRKTNDKKILHKVGKQWKVISVALLMAIGGGAAVATHANAQSTDGVNAATNAEADAVKQMPTVQAPQSANNASSASSSASAKPASAVSYVSGNSSAVSAASYSNKADNDNYSAQSNGAIVSGYVKSLNAKFGPAASLGNSYINSIEANAKSDAKLANSYSATAKNNSNNADVNSLAAKSGLTAGDYQSAVAWNVENIYTPNAKSASANASALNLASGLAEKLMAVNWTDVSAEANANSAVAKANDKVEQAKSNAEGFNNASLSVTNNNDALNSATVASIVASGVTAGVSVKQSSDNSSVNSYAKSNSLDATSVSSEVQSYAKANVKNNSYGATSYNFSNANSAVKNTNLLNSVVSDAASLYSANSVTAKNNSVIASAIAAKPSLANASASAKSAVAANSVASASALAASKVANNVSSAAKFVSNAMASGSASGALTLLNNRGQLKNILKGAGSSSLSKHVPYEVADVASVASAEGINLVALKNAKPALDAMAGDFTGVSAASLSSKASSVAKSVATDVANTTSQSASYSNATDENVTLASYFASSYSVNASSNASLASSYAADANAAYVKEINNPKFTAADAAMKAAQSAEPNDRALANAYGQRVYNYAPKYITTQKTFGLYNVNGKKYNRVATVPAGVRLAVNAVNIADNGQVRYAVNYNGKKGTVNSYPSYVQQTYLPVQDGVRINVTNPSKVYNSVDNNGFKKSIGTVKANTQLNVNIVSADGTFGGFTAAQILGGKLNGKFISANIAYAALVGSNNSANNNNNNHKNGNDFYFD